MMSIINNDNAAMTLTTILQRQKYRKDTICNNQQESKATFVCAYLHLVIAPCCNHSLIHGKDATNTLPPHCKYCYAATTF